MRRLILLLWRSSRNDLRMLWYALKQPARPGWLLPVAVGLGLYAVSPLNFAIPIVGVIDDFVVVPLALHWILKLLPRQMFAKFPSTVSRV